MFERLQKPYLTVETGEAYQPLRLVYTLLQPEKVVALLESLQCIEKTEGGAYQWFWRDECAALHFESLDDYQGNRDHPLRLGSFTQRDGKLYLMLHSFKRACLAVPFFHRAFDPRVLRLEHADFLNKVYGQDERLPTSYLDLFKEEELQAFIQQREQDFAKIEDACAEAESPEKALALLANYSYEESKKKLPFAERYEFKRYDKEDADLVFLGFYIFLRGRELVAIRRWFGEVSYTLANAADETIEQMFGGVGIDLID